MKPTRHPHVWLAIWLVAAAFAGAVLLSQSWAREIEPDTYRWYWARHIWQNAFDSLSAVCGSGLLLNRLNEDYTPAGRWVLFGLGQFGAILFLGAAARVMRTWQPDGARPRLPHPLTVVALFVVFQALWTAAVVFAARGACGTADAREAIQLSGTAFAAFGVVAPQTNPGTYLLLAAVGLIAALGWPVWLLILGPFAKRFVALRRTLLLMLGYIGFLLGCGLLICVFESPRPTFRPPRTDDRRISVVPLAERLPRSLVLAVAAGTAGVASEPVSDGRVREGTQMTLGALALVGGMGGSPGGGMKWPMLVALLGGTICLLRGRGAPVSRLVSAAGAALILIVGWALIVACGLLVIEACVASEFQRPPSFADAFLDSAAVVGGTALTGGVAATVTDPNLTSGMGVTANLYQYGMAWLMLAMLVGRVLPVFVLARAAQLPPDENEPPVPLL